MIINLINYLNKKLKNLKKIKLKNNINDKKNNLRKLIFKLNRIK